MSLPELASPESAGISSARLARLHRYVTELTEFGLGGSVVVDVAATGLPVSNGLFSWGGAASTSFWIDPAEELIGLFVTQLIPNDTMAIHKEMRRAVHQALVD